MSQQISGSLRERQKEYTRSLIFQALADLIVAGHIHDFTIQQIADEAGVSHRTVYRYFTNRDELLNELSQWMDEQISLLGGISASDVTTAEDLPHAAVVNFGTFDTMKDLMRAYVLIYLTSTQQVQTRTWRNQVFRRLIAEHAPNLPEEEITEGTTIIRHLANSTTWYALREYSTINGRQADQAVAWAIDTLLRDLKERSDQLVENPPVEPSEDQEPGSQEDTE